MNAVRQRCRPKHQVLVLKCYPRHQKNNVEVKPNSSELSYLLYYASTRRSKLQKVGDFLDKRTTSDVWKGRIGHVQVTLHILKALIDKTPRDLPLYAPAVLRIFRTILKSDDVTMIQETISAFETFCAHQDPAVLAADQDYIRQYEEIVQLYSSFASKDTPVQTKAAKSVPVLIRYRKAGLAALKAVAGSESLQSETSRQLAIIVPPILENIYGDSGRHLSLLEHREEEKVEFEKELAVRRRQSVSTVRTAETAEGDAIAASGTIEAADKLAEQETGVIALQALRTIFSQVPRGQLRLAVNEVLRFMAARVKPAEHFPSAGGSHLQTGSWPCTLFRMLCGWAPVQDRYIIMITTMEALVQAPVVEHDLEKQFVLAVIIGWLLSSDINFIGLSVMDVLVGLMQRILLLLQLGGHWTISEDEKTPDVVTETVQSVSPARIQLLNQLKRCIGSLAVHIYYSDQISDMIGALLIRLKPSPTPNPAAAASAIENPAATASTLASSASQVDPPRSDGFFSFDTARIAALDSVRAILAARPDTPSRSPVAINTWDGTQWLLRDNTWDVRVAYVDALLTWTMTELRPSALSVPDDHHPRTEKSTLARRAVSNASQRERSPRRGGPFLPLLHLAIFEQALTHASSAPDILLLHLLLVRLVQKLGANAASHGLPMIYRLAAEITPALPVPVQMNLAALVLGYLWALSVYFAFDAAPLGRAIARTVAARINAGAWLPGLKLPPLDISGVRARAADAPPAYPADMVLAPLELPARQALVDKIAAGYAAALSSPPSSPPSSPSRTFSNSYLPTTTRPLPQRVRDALLGEWSREAVVAATSSGGRDGSRSGSLSGSPTATVGTGRHLAAPPTALAENGLRSRPASGIGIAVSGGMSSTGRSEGAVRVGDLVRVLGGAALSPEEVEGGSEESLVTFDSASASEEDGPDTEPTPTAENPRPLTARSLQALQDQADIPPVPPLPLVGGSGGLSP
ncbi:hypothetical protein EJ06DRAFT_548940 [Trichodelitschia bisporula]|uniref:Protein EFR3 n=1 Tax=Trichodelitschia bisporula TaxID=703511 RepID=A0A6G1HWG0_9PEZI|nr:hypothetical protein EJ06DRAFT_548940 [Trichodelitschia bisporula]